MTLKPPTPSARFLIEDRFKITGRGLVLSGHLQEGMINPGDTIEFEANGTLRRRKITGVERARTATPDAKLGLMIKCLDEAEIDELRAWEPLNIPGTPMDGVVALVYEGDLANH